MSSNKIPTSAILRKPDWLKIKLPKGENYLRVKGLMEQNGLNTICVSGKCPNLAECWGLGTATFMILGEICTRSCKFCATKTGKPLAPDPAEPQKIADSVKDLNLKHVVITSVDRDDLPDGGASVWVNVIRTIRTVNPGVTIEALVPDFKGDRKSMLLVIDERPEVISHNLETVEKLTPVIRSGARYRRSLDVLNQVATQGVTTKSGLMVGLGETEDEVYALMDDLRSVGCSILTIGQYLQPTKNHIPVKEYIPYRQFERYREAGLSKGFVHVESKPLVRSSYHAEKHV